MAIRRMTDVEEFSEIKQCWRKTGVKIPRLHIPTAFQYTMAAASAVQRALRTGSIQFFGFQKTSAIYGWLPSMVRTVLNFAKPSLLWWTAYIEPIPLKNGTVFLWILLPADWKEGEVSNLTGPQPTQEDWIDFRSHSQFYEIVQTVWGFYLLEASIACSSNVFFAGSETMVVLDSSYMQNEEEVHLTDYAIRAQTIITTSRSWDSYSPHVQDHQEQIKQIMAGLAKSEVFDGPTEDDAVIGALIEAFDDVDQIYDLSWP
ncbi:hypothetical protein Dimus_039579 [Dionaea muscipula]